MEDESHIPVQHDNRVSPPFTIAAISTRPNFPECRKQEGEDQGVQSSQSRERAPRARRKSREVTSKLRSLGGDNRSTRVSTTGGRMNVMR